MVHTGQLLAEPMHDTLSSTDSSLHVYIYKYNHMYTYISICIYVYTRVCPTLGIAKYFQADVLIHWMLLVSPETRWDKHKLYAHTHTHCITLHCSTIQYRTVQYMNIYIYIYTPVCLYIYICIQIHKFYLKFSVLRDPLFFVKNQVIQASRRSSSKAITQVPWLSNSSHGKST